MSEIKAVPSAIEWPKAFIGETEYTFRLAYSANYQLTTWGKTIGTATVIELAAAMAGSFDKRGKWKSAGFAKPLDVADELTSDQEAPLIEAVTEALKKAYPELEVISQPGPGTDATKKNEPSGSGPSPLPEAVSA